MKKLIRRALVGALLVGLGGPVAAQDRGMYYDLRKGGSYQRTTYDAKGQATGRIIQAVNNVQTSGGKTTATLHQQVFNKKDQLTTEGDFTVECQAGLVRMDMRTLMGAQTTPGTPKQQADMDMELTGDILELPATLKPGSALKDGTMTATLRDRKSGVALSTTTISVSNRKVEGAEPVETAAGTFQCVKVSQDMLLKAGLDALAIPFALRSVEWYAPGVGAVRSETYRKDKLMGYSLLTATPR